jgi:hypothetical protein
MSTPEQNLTRNLYRLLAITALVMVMAVVIFMVLDHPGVMAPVASK